ncbi:putative ribonuclease H-like domain-containing protein [Tanacetum coccineum]
MELSSKNKEMNQFFERKDIKREFIIARTPQQNGVAERKNRTLIEATRTMLADSKLPTTFWAKAVNTACYVQNRVLVTKPHNKTPYELFLGRKPAFGFMRPFGCPVTILNTIDHIDHLLGSGPNWHFDIDALTKSMNYKPVIAGNQSNGNAGTKACDDAGKARMETVPGKDYILLPLWPADLPFSQNLKSPPDARFKPSGDDEKKETDEPGKKGGDSSNDQEKEDNVNNTNNVNAASTNEVNVVGAKTSIELPDDPNMPELEDIVYSNDDEDVGAEADMNNLDAFMPVSPIPTTRIHKDHPVKQIIRDLNSAPQTRRMTKNLEEHGLFSSVQQRTNHKDFQNCLFAYFLSQEEPKKVIHALKDPSWIEAMQDELLQFKLQKDERGIVIKNKAILVAQGYTQEEGIDYDEVFAHVARIKSIRLFLAYDSFKDFVVYQMDVNSAFLYGKIKEEVYICQPPGFEDPDFIDRRGKIDKTLFIKRDKGDILLVQVYVDDTIFGSTKKSLSIELEKMMHEKFQMSSMGELRFFLGLQVKQKKYGIFISQDKYDKDGEEVDVHLYRSMIGSLKYLTSLRTDIMFVVCACARYQVNPKVSHLHAMKRIFRYLKGQPKLGLWYPKDSPFDLVAYTDSDYAGASLDRKSTIGGCQFLGCRLISWQCKKQTVVANSIIEAEYVVASSCCGQVPWIQNQLLDYGYNFMHTKIYIDNKSTICIVKNPSFHSKTKHIEIRHHFIRDSNEKKPTQMIKIYTDKNVADLLTKAFDATVKVKTVNGEQQLQALVDGKKIVVTEASVRRDLQLDVEEGTDCLPNATIFEELTRMGYEKLSQKLTFYKVFFSPQWKFLIHTVLQCLNAKTTTWNEFSSTMAYAIICLATNQKFNFSKYIFESMVKNMDNAGKFLMYPRFIQVFLDNQLEGMSSHKRIYVTPSHIKKIFANMRRQGKDFSGRVTPLFPTMVVQAQEEMGEGLGMPTDPHHTPIITQPSSSQPQRKQKSRRSKRKDTEVPQPSNPINVADEAVNKEPKITLVDETQRRHDDDIMFDVSDLAGEEVFVAEQGVPNSKKDDVVQVNTNATTVSTANTIPVSAATIIEDEITLAQALAELKSVKPKVTTTTTATTKGILLQEPSELITTTTTIPSKDKEKIDVDYQMAKQMQAEEQEELSIEEKSKLFVQLLEARKKHFAAKRAEEKRNMPPTRAQQRSIMVNTFIDMDTELVECSEVRAEGSETREESSSNLMKVISNEKEVVVDDIPLATKPPSIMLRSFDREDLEILWKLVKAKHGYTRTKEGYERVLWGDLKIMFEHHVEDTLWRNLQGNKKRYPLTPATITEMLNKKLQADHWNEMCYQLLKLITKQLKNQ